MNPLLDFWHRHQKLRFLVIGVWNTLFGYLIFIALYHFWGNENTYITVAITSHFVAVINAFIGHKYLVFRSKHHWSVEFLRFNLSYLFMLMLSIFLLIGFVEFLHLHPIVAQGITLTSSVIISYFAHKYFSFR